MDEDLLLYVNPWPQLLHSDSLPNIENSRTSDLRQPSVLSPNFDITKHSYSGEGFFYLASNGQAGKKPLLICLGYLAQLHRYKELHLMPTAKL